VDLGSRKDTMAIRRLARFVMTPARKLALRKAQKASAAAARRKGKKVIAGKVKRKAVRAASKRIQRKTTRVVSNAALTQGVSTGRSRVQKIGTGVALAGYGTAIAANVEAKKRRNTLMDSLSSPKSYRPRNVGRSKAAEQEYKRKRIENLLSAQRRLSKIENRRTMLDTRGKTTYRDI